jgi:uncharacterized protein GlcG (DUF336 family)
MADSYSRGTISADGAHRLIAAVEAEADTLGRPFMTATVDDGDAAAGALGVSAKPCYSEDMRVAAAVLAAPA